MLREARVFSSGSKSGRTLECEGAVPAYPFVQNEPNLLRFQANNADQPEKRSQTKPICGRWRAPQGAKGIRGQGADAAYLLYAKQSQFTAFVGWKRRLGGKTKPIEANSPGLAGGGILR